MMQPSDFRMVTNLKNTKAYNGSIDWTVVVLKYGELEYPLDIERTECFDLGNGQWELIGHFENEKQAFKTFEESLNCEGASLEEAFKATNLRVGTELLGEEAAVIDISNVVSLKLVSKKHGISLDIEQI
ncbi:hypothetical protein [Vibrio mediterranei]|uniref:hypothetical protein n=1 Tax=Vibrio mediterranei TaxID=689 RepID=UPI0040689A7F